MSRTRHGVLLAVSRDSYGDGPVIAEVDQVLVPIFTLLVPILFETGKQIVPAVRASYGVATSKDKARRTL